ncbi:helix-turn-helix domain-containing protein [Acuticoccus sp. I52.16.1]|uniref:winged helix-turn-helix transcriptional regulator n=1 Tax=Acuticoccus sp. I52.16.1 TaxID=2928472 RepID=UPI001FD6054F|nr:helix-turn-helix domain-containing protein [Acuticoccus sp. I52.16.1]UOM35222.1 helix-turn-helix transcriptional regulator [Acuticoccus sp. I52.16.1]
MKWQELGDEACPVARAMSVVGDRWTLLLLRDCFRGVRRFEAFQERLGITRHVLADRLRKLVEAGVLTREPYQDRPPRYEYRLTETGRAFHPVLVTLMAWGEAAVPGGSDAPLRLVSRQTGAPVRPLLVDEATGEPITPANVRATR